MELAVGDLDRAARLLGALSIVREAHVHSLTEEQRAVYEALHCAVREALGPTAFGVASEAGRAMPYEEVIRFVLSEPNSVPLA